ncbi:MAG: cytochrome c3 family protein [Armatimonadota bacterium]
MRKQNIFIALTIALALIGLHAKGWAAPACLACHTAPSMARSRVTPDSLADSTHKRLTCRDCHAGMSDQPISHAHPAPRVDCKRCHGSSGLMGAKPINAVKHGRTDTPAGILPKCADCHGTHNIKPASGLGSAVNRQNIVQTCAQCHGPGGAAAERIGSKQVIEFERSVHSRRNPKNPGQVAAVCTDCHGNHAILPKNNPQSHVNKRNVPNTCGRCHAQEYKDYQASIHGKALAKGITDAPSCTDCHGEHNILGPKDSASSVSGFNVIETCARCHSDKVLIRRYNLPLGRVESYRKSYHGVANRFGEILVANCASCHRAHKILPDTDALSSVFPANLPQTCGSPNCHPGAGPNFARGNMHLMPSPQSDKAVYWVTVGYMIFIWALIAQFVLLIIADLVQHGRRGWKTHEPEASRPLDHVKVQRFTRSQLLQHVTLIVSFTMLLITGLPLRFADSAAAGWIIWLFGGVTVRGNIHRLMAALLIAVCIWHLLWTVFTRRGRADFINMLPKPKDIKRAIGMMKYYFGLSMEMPGFGRFNLIEKFEYLAMGWGSVVMIVTGFALWFPQIALNYIPKWGLDICHVVHGYEAVLAFLAITIWHFYHVHLIPGIFPMSHVWLDGEVTLAEMRHEHRQEYDRLTRELMAKRGIDSLDAATPEQVRQTTEELESHPSPDNGEEIPPAEEGPKGPEPDQTGTKESSKEQ